MRTGPKPVVPPPDLPEPDRAPVLMTLAVLAALLVIVAAFWIRERVNNATSVAWSFGWALACLLAARRTR